MANKTVTLKVGGMSCSHCVGAVTNALNGVGASEVDVNLGAGTVEISYDPEAFELEAAVNAIEDAGYDVVG